MRPTAQLRGVRLDLAAALAFQLILSLAFLNEPIHLDEPCFLAMAGQALRTPLHPARFLFFWNGRLAPMSEINPNFPLLAWLMAPGLALSGGREWVLRLACLPVELLAAMFLYLLAARFLSRPFLPVAAALAGPGYWINIHLMMAEKWVAALGFASLYALVRAADEDADEGEEGWWLASAILAALALLAKYSAVFLIVPAVAYGLSRGRPRGRILGWLGLALGPAALHLAWGLISEPGRSAAVLWHAGSPLGLLWSADKLRSLLTFTAGCAPALLLLPWFLPGGRTWRLTGAIAGASLLLPAFDLYPVTAGDRFLGIVLAAGGGASLAAIIENSEGLRGRALWLPWIAGALALQLLAYWAVVSRFILFPATALVLALAEALERRTRPALARRLLLACFCLTFVLGAGAAWTDALHARVQRGVAEMAAADAKRIWYTGHWGLQYYLERRGARPLDPAQGGWDQARSGDRVVVPGISSYIVLPRHGVAARGRLLEFPGALPIRLMCSAGWSCRAGFHASSFGFLPFSFSREPVDRFQIVDIR